HSQKRLVFIARMKIFLRGNTRASLEMFLKKTHNNGHKKTSAEKLLLKHSIIALREEQKP
ncbi:MAG: hypothetical protein M3Q97_07370, partial [Bacteroidota bacterium]|nr:hypothetical protein [Bacteroidota bacterium]